MAPTSIEKGVIVLINLQCCIGLTPSCKQLSLWLSLPVAWCSNMVSLVLQSKFV